MFTISSQWPPSPRRWTIRTAKYHLDKLKGVSMMTLARSADNRKLTPYHRMCVEQMKQLADRIECELGLR